MGEAEVGEDFGDGVAAVEGVEVDAVDAPIQEFPHLVGGDFDAEFARCILVVGEAVKLCVYVGRDGGAAEGGEPADLLGVQDGKDASEDGRVDARFSRPVHEGIEVAVVEEKLGNEEAGAHFQLQLGVLQVALQVGGLQVSLRVAGGGDVEVEVVADVADEVRRVGEAALDGDEVGLAAGRVAAEGDDVFDACFLQSCEDAVNLVPGLADAGEMGHWQQVGLFFDGGDYLLGEGLGGAACAVGDGDEVGIEGGESIDCPKDGGDALPGSGAGRIRRRGWGSPLVFR